MPGADEPLRRAKDYQKIKQVLTLWNLGLTPLLILIPAVTPLSSLFYSWAGSVIGCRYGALAFYFMFLSLFFMIFDLPLSFYSGYMLEHRFKLSNLTLKGWGGVFVKKALLSFGLSLALLEGLYALIWNFPERWWIFAWVCYAGVSYGIGKLFPVLIHQGYPERITSRTKKSLSEMTYLTENYLIIWLTTPAPTVLPPSRTAKRSSFSIAIGVISSASTSVLSPGMTISTPCGSLTTPVTSVVRK